MSEPGSRIFNLCFHGIGEPGRALEPGEARYWVSAARYAEMLDAVQERDDVRISFDDGNASDVEFGLPGLVRRGLRATFFVLAGRIDQPGSLSSGQLGELVGAGMTVGTHGMRHRSWRGLDEAARTEEWVQARDRIAQVIGQPVTQAALPLGQYDRNVLRGLRGCGYRQVHTSDRMSARPGSWLQPRFSARAEDTAADLNDRILVPSTGRLIRGRLAHLVKRVR